MTVVTSDDTFYRICSQGRFVESMSFARRIASLGPLAGRTARESLLHGLGSDFDEGMAYDAERFREVM